MAVCGAVSAPAFAEPEITVPDGFSIDIFHEGVGRARHLAVRENGDVFVGLRSGRLIALRDADKDGAADEVQRRRAPIHTGAEIYEGFLYVSDARRVSRIALGDDLMPDGPFETMVSGFPTQTQHEVKPFAFDGAGGLYVNVGAPSNACQEEMRTPGSPGLTPCPQLARQAGVWRFSATTPGQTQADGERFATGSRNSLAIAWHAERGALYAVPHGRDQLDTLWPEHFSAEDNAEAPGGEVHLVREGAHLGWPFTYYDPRKNQRMLAPEYGGDGDTPADAGAYAEPIYVFPGHWAPNDMEIYLGDQFPERYRGGAFIAFHGSWNRAPLPQEGYRVSFLPLGEDGAGPSEDFATGFSGDKPILSPSAAPYRPTGLAIGPDGALFIADSVDGRIWKVTYEGGA
ncbi:MAG: PQQ-dependent sugar dehydrogenase [Pseudomonadota bacterium]